VVNSVFNTQDGDATGDRNAFWEERNYRPNVGNVHAAVFAVHGFQDDNVKMSQLWPWWSGLKGAGVPRKLWLLRSGHTDPFDARRDVWVDTIHRWFDHWLYGVDNGIMDEPAVTIEDDKDVWGEYGDWPIPGTSDVNVFLQGTTADAAGALRGTSGGPLDSVAFTGTANVPSETTVINTPEGAQTSRRVFLSRPLAKDVRLSGLATIDLHASLSTTQSNLGAVLVDYNATTFPEVSRSGEGITASGPADSCWGASSTYDNPCYQNVTKPIQNVTQWRVTRGILDSSNRDSLTTPSPVTPGQEYAFSIPLEPTEHTFAAGHRIGVVIVGNLLGTGGTPSSNITVDTKLTKLVLPVAGGDAAARAAALTDETAPTTTASFAPAANAAGWTRASALTLTVADGDGSGAASLAYTLNGAPHTVSAGSATVPLADGNVALSYAATDRAGHVETEKSLTLKVDHTVPAVTFTHPTNTTFARGAAVPLTHTCTDGGSGIATCTGPATLDTTKAGAFTAVVKAADIAGNTASQSWAYAVLGTLPKLGLKTKPGRKVTLTSPVAATVKISGGVRSLTVKLEPGVARTVKLKPKKKRAKKVKLKLVTIAGALKRTETKTISLRR
jgi:X-Pro dipeptidyl-peptidase